MLRGSHIIHRGYHSNIFLQETSRFHEEIGNTTQNMDLTVEFQTKDKEKAKKLENIPFQVQITYRRPDQMKCLRVISKCQKFTQKRQDIEKVKLIKMIHSVHMFHVRAEAIVQLKHYSSS